MHAGLIAFLNATHEPESFRASMVSGRVASGRSIVDRYQHCFSPETVHAWRDASDSIANALPDLDVEEYRQILEALPIESPR